MGNGRVAQGTCFICCLSSYSDRYAAVAKFLVSNESAAKRQQRIKASMSKETLNRSSSSCNQENKSLDKGNSSQESPKVDDDDYDDVTVTDSSDSQHNRLEKKGLHSKRSSYSDSEESYESEAESAEKFNSDSDSGESFENDFTSPANSSHSEEANVTDDEFAPQRIDPALNVCRNSRPSGEAKSGTSAQSGSETGESQEAQTIGNQRRKVQWANPQDLNWSFHEGFEDSASRKRRHLKRWNSSDDLESSSDQRRNGRRGSSKNNDKRQLNQVRDPPGHHIESPSAKTKILSIASKPQQKAAAHLQSLQAPLPAVVEDGVNHVDDDDAMSSGYESESSSTSPTQPLHMHPIVTSVKPKRVEGTHENDPWSPENINFHTKRVPVRRTQSSDGITGTTTKIRRSNLSDVSSDGFTSKRSASCHSAPAATSRIVVANEGVDRREAASEWQSFARTGWVSTGKENPTLSISNATSRPNEAAMSKRTPGQLSSSLHYIRPKTRDETKDSSKLHSQSLHAYNGFNTKRLTEEAHYGKNEQENNSQADIHDDDSSRSTEVSSESPSFGLQISQSSLSSFPSVESSVAKNHRNRSATSSIMSSATLTLNVCQARHLKSLERNIFGRMRPTEPVVELYLGGKNCGKTGIARRSTNPVWKESEIVCEIGGDMARELSSRIEKLELRIYDRSSKKENFMGAVTFTLPIDYSANWYNVAPRSEQDEDFFCAGASGSLEVKVQMSAKFYPELMPEHVLILRQHSKIALDLSWGTLSPMLDTSCVATDRKDGLVLWEESVYDANRTNPNRSIVFPERLELPGHPMIDTLVLDLNNVPKKVGAFCLVLAAREKSLAEVESFEIRCKDALTGQGIGRFVPRFKSLETSAILLRISRSKKNKAWELEVMTKGYKGFREFGSMLPEVQMISQSAIIPYSKPAERTALMRAGDRIRIIDYVSTLPENLCVGLFWKVANGESLLPVALLLDKYARHLEVIHRMNTQSHDFAVIHEQGKFVVNLKKVSSDIKYICFSLGPYLGEQADHILTTAFHILNTADGTELVRNTIPDFDRFPTRTVTIGCFYRSVDSWDFALLGLPSGDSTIDECTRTIQKYLIERPLEPSPPLIVEA